MLSKNRFECDVRETTPAKTYFRRRSRRSETACNEISHKQRRKGKVKPRGGGDRGTETSYLERGSRIIVAERKKTMLS